MGRSWIARGVPMSCPWVTHGLFFVESHEFLVETANEMPTGFPKVCPFVAHGFLVGYP